MKKSLWTILLSLLLSWQGSCQIFTSDVANFWTAYDSVRAVSDPDRQVDYITRLYIEKASDGLKAFLKNKDNAARKWVDVINADPAFWEGLRSKTAGLEPKVLRAKEYISKFRALYPGLKDADTYLLIGFRQQGGTIRGNLSLIGTEVVFSSLNGLADDALFQMIVHEYVHTQQKKPNFQEIDVLTSSIREGACDFVAEKILDKPFQSDYITYGLKHGESLWRVFKRDMHTRANSFWVSTGNNPTLPVQDPGYYIGYAICRAYYDGAPDKSKALADIIELDYADHAAVEKFFADSGFDRKMKDSKKSVPVEGYTSKDDEIVFTFDPKGKSYVDEKGVYKIMDPTQVQTVSIAGDFNKWEVQGPSWSMQNRNGVYTLRVPKKQLGNPGESPRFRFVVNGKWWVLPGFDIANRTTDRNENTNLFLTL